MGLCFYTFKAKTPNFRPAAVAFWSVASPSFACALLLPPSATRALLFPFAMNESNARRKSSWKWGVRNGATRIRNDGRHELA